MSSLFCEHTNLDYVHIHVICRVNQAEYVIRVRVCVIQEYVNTNEQALVRLSNKYNLDASRCQPIHCTMASNRFVLLLCWPNLCSH